MFVRYIPSPSQSSFEVGPLTFHFYALCIIAGIAVAIWLGDKRLRAHDPSLVTVVSDVAIFAVPAGIIGGRIYSSAVQGGRSISLQFGKEDWESGVQSLLERSVRIGDIEESRSNVKIFHFHPFASFLMR